MYFNAYLKKYVFFNKFLILVKNFFFCCIFHFLEPEKNLIRVKLESRHYSAKKFNVYIKYDPSNNKNHIKNWFCACVDGKNLNLISIF